MFELDHLDLKNSGILNPITLAYRNSKIEKEYQKTQEIL